MTFDVRKSVHHYTIQIIQLTICNYFTSILLDVYVWLNMFRAPPLPSSGAYNCTGSLWFLPLERNGWRVVGRSLTVASCWLNYLNGTEWHQTSLKDSFHSRLQHSSLKKMSSFFVCGSTAQKVEGFTKDFSITSQLSFNRTHTLVLFSNYELSIIRSF
jgi:hypothetical protein